MIYIINGFEIMAFQLYWFRIQIQLSKSQPEVFLRCWLCVLNPRPQESHEALVTIKLLPWVINTNQFSFDKGRLVSIWRSFLQALNLCCLYCLLLPFLCHQDIEAIIWTLSWHNPFPSLECMLPKPILVCGIEWSYIMESTLIIKL